MLFKTFEWIIETGNVIW